MGKVFPDPLPIPSFAPVRSPALPSPPKPLLFTHCLSSQRLSRLPGRNAQKQGGPMGHSGCIWDHCVSSVLRSSLTSSFAVFPPVRGGPAIVHSSLTIVHTEPSHQCGININIDNTRTHISTSTHAFARAHFIICALYGPAAEGARACNVPESPPCSAAHTNRQQKTDKPKRCALRKGEKREGEGGQ